MSLYPEAIENHSKALSIQLQHGLHDHPSTGQIRLNMGMTFYKQGKYIEANELFVKAFSIYKKALGNDHQYTKEAKMMVEWCNSYLLANPSGIEEKEVKEEKEEKED